MAAASSPAVASPPPGPRCGTAPQVHPPTELAPCVSRLSAPPLAEALIATAMGLFAAIPAVIAYNRYADKVVRLVYRYDGFSEEFSSILKRHARSRQGG